MITLRHECIFLHFVAVFVSIKYCMKNAKNKKEYFRVVFVQNRSIIDFL